MFVWNQDVADGIGIEVENNGPFALTGSVGFRQPPLQEEAVYWRHLARSSHVVESRSAFGRWQIPPCRRQAPELAKAIGSLRK